MQLNKQNEELTKFVGKQCEVFRVNSNGDLVKICEGEVRYFNWNYGHCVVMDNDSKWFVLHAILKRKRDFKEVKK